MNIFKRANQTEREVRSLNGYTELITGYGNRQELEAEK